MQDCAESYLVLLARGFYVHGGVVVLTNPTPILYFPTVVVSDFLPFISILLKQASLHWYARLCRVLFTHRLRQKIRTVRVLNKHRSSQGWIPPFQRSSLCSLLIERTIRCSTPLKRMVVVQNQVAPCKHAHHL